jgi:membrane protein YqaA with SNARE-associated domain
MLSIFIFLPIIGISISILTGIEEFSPIFILVAIGQTLIIRYIFIALAFKRLSKNSLRRLQDILDIEWI